MENISTAPQESSRNAAKEIPKINLQGSAQVENQDLNLSEAENELLNLSPLKKQIVQNQHSYNNLNEINQNLIQQKAPVSVQAQEKNENIQQAQKQQNAQQLKEQIVKPTIPKKESKKQKDKVMKDKLICFGDIISLVTTAEIKFDDQQIPNNKKTLEWVIYDDGFAFSDPQIIPKELTITNNQRQTNITFNQVVRLCLFKVENARPYLQIPEEQKEFEEMGNKDEFERVIGTPLTYGERITLRHIHSNGFLSIKYDEVAKQRGCMKVYISKEAQLGSIFEIHSIQSQAQVKGIAIQYDAKFILINKAQQFSIKYYLNAHKSEIDNNPNARVQVNAGLVSTQWQAQKFLGHQVIIQQGILYSGDPIKFLHVDFNG